MHQARPRVFSSRRLYITRTAVHTRLPAPSVMLCRAVGGLEAEREARAAYQREQDEAQRRNFEALQAIRREGWRKVGAVPVLCCTSCSWAEALQAISRRAGGWRRVWGA